MFPHCRLLSGVGSGGSLPRNHLSLCFSPLLNWLSVHQSQARGLGGLPCRQVFFFCGRSEGTVRWRSDILQRRICFDWEYFWGLACLHGGPPLSHVVDTASTGLTLFAHTRGVLDREVASLAPSRSRERMLFLVKIKPNTRVFQTLMLMFEG